MNKSYDGFRSFGQGENLDKLIKEGLDVLAEDNPLNHVIIDIKDTFEGGYDVDMINLL